MDTKPRLILVGEYNLFRECLASMLAGLGRFTVAFQAATLEAAGTLLEAQRSEGEPSRDASPAEVVLVDVGVGGPAFLETLKRFAETWAEIKIVALGLEESERVILPIIEAGAAAYVLKEASVEELAEVIERVLRGEAVCSPQIASKMFSRLADLARDRRRVERLEALALTSRELEVLQLVADGYSNKEIASELFLSFHTVKNHVHNILEKLKVRHRSQAVDYAYRMRWLRGRQHILGDRGGL